MKINDELEVLIEGMDKDGRGIAYNNKKIIFIAGALIGEICLIKITKILSKYIEGTLIKVIKETKDRINIDCPIYQSCGGCNMRHMSYELEKTTKYNKVKNTIIHQAKINNFKMNDLISNDNIYNYRNKAIIPFKKENGKIICGMFKANSHEIIDNKKCLIEPILLEKILNIVVNYLEKNNISIYDETTKKGLFRAIMCRKSKYDKYMIVLIATASYDFSNLVNELKEIKEIVSIYLNINDLNNNVLLGNINKLLYGDTYLKEEILNNKYNVSPNSFMQVNNLMTELLYKEVIRLLNPSKEDIVIDAYCGMGSITLSLANKVKEIIGIEVVEAAIINARENAVNNNINNATFILGKCEDKIAEAIKSKNVTKMVFDPPRKGCDKTFLDTIKAAKIKTIVYVSCNVATLARDIACLKDIYKVIEVTPVDLFPRTSHVETIAKLLYNETA